MNNPNNLTKNWSTAVNKELSIEEFLMAVKLLKRCTTLVNHEGNANQDTLRFHLIHVRRVKFNDKSDLSYW